MKLYWVTTEDHCEDWFILASSAKEAANLFFSSFFLPDITVFQTENVF